MRLRRCGVAEQSSRAMADAHVIQGAGPARDSAFRIWLQAVRAPSLSASVMPVLLGTILAARDGFFAPLRFLLALLGAMAIQAGTNLINDYYDHQKGADSPD